jgi:phosphohistidine swiveling domain-containing protein
VTDPRVRLDSSLNRDGKIVKLSHRQGMFWFFCNLLDLLYSTSRRNRTSAKLVEIAQHPDSYGVVLDKPKSSFAQALVNAAAVILEVGGMLQHGALVAREYGLPCVSGVANTTTLWMDGTLVEIDGAAGVICVLETPEMNATADSAVSAH